MNRRLFLGLCAGIAVAPRVLAAEPVHHIGWYAARHDLYRDSSRRSAQLTEATLRLIRANQDAPLAPWIPNRARSAYRP